MSGSKRSPGSAQLHTHFFPQHFDKNESGDYIETSQIPSNVEDSDQPRRMYVREQFTHENAMRGNITESNDSMLRR